MPLPFEKLRDAIAEATNAADTDELSESERVSLLQMVTRLATKLEKPEDAITKLVYSPSRFVAIRVCLDLNIFQQIVDDGPVTSQELAKSTSADRILIERLLRVLTASDIVIEMGVTTYAANKITKAFTARTMNALVQAIYDVGLPGLISIPEYLRRTDYRNPEDANNGSFQLSKGLTNQNIFSWLAENPREQSAMQAFFEADRGSRPNWVDWFPVQEKLLQNFSPGQDDLVLVDVAGGRGHEVSAFLDKFPELPGRYVLQDLPHVLSDEILVLNPRIEKKEMDFWTEGPVRSARIYYMKFIMHDWSDEKCLQILTNVTSAMKHGHSWLIIEDFILPDIGCHALSAMWDMEMMAFLSAMERTKSQWQSLLKAAKLKVLGMYDPPGDGTGIIMSCLDEVK